MISLVVPAGWVTFVLDYDGLTHAMTRANMATRPDDIDILACGVERMPEDRVVTTGPATCLRCVARMLRDGL